MNNKLELWFFRDLSDTQRLKLFGLFGFPVDEIEKVPGGQTIAARHLVKKLLDLVRDEMGSALTNTSGDDEAPVAWLLRDDTGREHITRRKTEGWDRVAAVPLYARQQSAAVRDENTWRSMDSAPRDGAQFIALEKNRGGRIYARVYEWVGEPNYWSAKREGVCIRPEYQDRYQWTPLPSAALHSTQER